MATEVLTQSGYPVIGSYSDSRLVGNPAIPGTGGAVRALGGLRAGSVALCLLYVAARWHREVEPLEQALGCWGYELRTIHGSSTISNHAGGCALDLNAVLHPQGTEGTVTAAQLVRIQAIESAVAGALNWGGRWLGRSIDAMHWQVQDGHAGAPVDQLADSIRRGRLANVPTELRAGNQPPDDPPPAPISSSAPPYPFVRGDGRYFGPLSGPAQSISGAGPNDGQYRPALASWQRRVSEVGIPSGTADGFYGPVTAAAARKLQQRAGITVDGLIGWDTWQAAWAGGSVLT